jgi:hypothetical protein
MHPNDTLQGKLYAFELEDEKCLRGVFGYWHMVEERMILAQLKTEGVEATLSAVSARMIENHRGDESFADQSRRLHLGLEIASAAKQQAQMNRAGIWEEAREECLEALRQIRDGHNDPRELARIVLEKLEAVWA